MSHYTPQKIVFKISENKKEKGLYCCAHGCKNEPHKKKKGLCHKHYHVYRRQVDPVENRFVNFKRNALRRGKEFTISLQEFRAFCETTGYIVTKGLRGFKATVDRIDNKRGYHIDNIQLLTMKANIAKYNLVDKKDENYTPF
jgi:hypothetical protein